MTEPLLSARNLVKRYGRVTAMTMRISTSIPARSWLSSATTVRASPA